MSFERYVKKTLKGLEPMMEDFVVSRFEYGVRGASVMVGFEPTTLPLGAPGTQYWRFGTSDTAMGISRGSLPKYIGNAGMLGMSAPKSFLEAAGMMGASLAQPAFLAYDLAAGYSEGGIWGAKDALVWNVAQNAAAASAIYSFAPQAGVMVPKTAGFVSSMARNIGAGVGASVGQSIGGTPGAFVGAYIGARPLAALMAPGQMLGKIPRIGGVLAGGYGFGLGVGAAALAGTAVAAATTLGPIYAAHKMTQFGAQWTASRRHIGTAGDVGAFMTNNAMTSRARAVQAIQRSHLNGRSALGMEASYLHTGKSYGSPYRQGWM